MVPGRGLLLAVVPVLALAGTAGASSLDRPELTFGSPEAVRFAVKAILDPGSLGDVRATGVTCRTPYLHAGLAMQATLGPDVQALLAAGTARPRAPEAVLAAGDRVWLHTGRPDGREIADEIRRVVALLSETLGDPQLPRAVLDVYVQPLSGATGTVVWDDAAAPVGVLVSDGLERPVLVREVLHQLVHVWQLERAGTTPIPAAWLEGVAVHVASVLAGSPEDLAAAIVPAMRQRHAPLDALSPRLLRSRASLSAYLCEASGTGLGAVALLFSDLGRGWDARLQETLATLDLGSPAGFHLEHALWLTLTRPEDLGTCFSFARSLPALVPAELGANARSRVVLPAGGFEALRIAAAPRDGGLWISVRSRDDAHLRGAVILRRTGPSGKSETRVAPLPATAPSGYRIGVPLRWAEEAVVVIASSARGRLPVQVATSHDAVFPYVLSSFTTEPTEGGVLVQWTVTEEQGVAGWRVQRSVDPARGFTPLPAAIPSRGDARDPISYTILDTSARPGRRYFYYIEGVSVYGFSQPSLLVSVTTPSR